MRKSAGSRWHILTISSRALSGNTIGFDETECAHIGVMHIPPRRGSRTGPPADSEYAVEPVGVAAIRPSARYVAIVLPPSRSSISTIRATEPFDTTASFSARAM